MAHYFNTPQTEAVDRTRATFLDFSELPSFAAPAGDDDLVKTMREGKPNTKYAPLRTPSARVPLAGRPNPPVKPEFTPILKSAMRQAMTSQARDRFQPSTTPAPSKVLFPFSSPALPERSILGESEMNSIDQTPMPMGSSSSMGTPLPNLPGRGELGSNNGNLLTLKEQEAVCLTARAT
jgi:hypothetical protein